MRTAEGNSLVTRTAAGHPIDEKGNIRTAQGKPVLDVDGNAVHNNTPLATLEKTSAALTTQLEAKHREFEKWTTRKAELNSDEAEIDGQRCDLHKRLAAGEKGAADALDRLDNRQRASQRERAGVVAHLAAVEEAIASLTQEQQVVHGQAATIRRALRQQELQEKALEFEKNAVQAYRDYSAALGKLRVGLEELVVAGGNAAASRIRERLLDSLNPVALKNSGWKDPEILEGLNWRFQVLGLLPPEN